jgi:hypothetical protein
VVASVAGEQIHLGQLEHWRRIEAAVAAGHAASSRSEALTLLIHWQWARDEARSAGVRVNGQEVERQLTLSEEGARTGTTFEWFHGEAPLRRYLASGSLGHADRVLLVSMGMLEARLRQQWVAVAGDRIARASLVSYYRSHLNEFTRGERRDIRAIMNRHLAPVVEAKHQLEAGVAFKTVAERFNQSAEGGLRLGRARGEGHKRYEKDYFAAPLHVLVGPLKEILYYVFEVLSIKPARVKPFGEAEGAIRKRFGERAANTTLMAAYERRWRARTRCLAGYSSPGCGR